MAVLQFEASDEKAKALSPLIETKLAQAIAGLPRIELIERAEIDRILSEVHLSMSDLAANPSRGGEMLGAQLLAFGSVTQTPGLLPKAHAVVLDVSTGEVICEAAAEIGQDPDAAADHLMSAVRERLPKALELLNRYAGKPSATVLTVRNASKVERLGYLAPVIARMLEQSVDAAGNFRLLRRQFSGMVHRETNGSISDLERDSAKVAERADIVLTAEFEEKPTPGVSLQQTPIEVRVHIARRNAPGEDVVESGQIEHLDALLTSLAESVRRSLGGVIAADAAAQESATSEAALLLSQAVASALESPDYSLVSEEQHLQRRIELLDRALSLDPGLTVARYWLGEALERSAFGQGVSSKLVAQHERAANELEVFLRNTPAVDSRRHDLGFSRVWMSTATGDLRARAYLKLIYAWHSVRRSSIQAAEEGNCTTAERDAFRHRAELASNRVIEWTATYLLEPPRKEMSSQEHLFPFMCLRDAGNIDGAVDWLLFVNTIYDADHESYNVRCPLFEAADLLLKNGRAGEALHIFERGLLEHPHGDRSITTEGLLAKIYRALGYSTKAERIEELNAAKQRAAEQEKAHYEELVNRFAEWPLRTRPPVVPDEVVIERMPREEDRRLQVFASAPSGEYGFTGRSDSQYSGSIDLEDWVKNESQGVPTLLHRRANGSNATDLPLSHGGKAARVTAILPVGKFVWFATHQGIARYNPAKNEWRWFTDKEGLPTNRVLCGAASEKSLWFGGGEDETGMIFSLDIDSQAVRLFPLPQGARAILHIATAGDSVLAGDHYNLWLHEAGSVNWRPVGRGADDLQPTTPAVKVGDRWIIGCEAGLSAVDTATAHPSLALLYSSGWKKESSGKFEKLCMPPDSPLSDPVSALQSDGRMLWIANGPALTAFDPAADAWYGPFSFAEKIGGLSLAGDHLIILGEAPCRIDCKKFLDAAARAGLARTTSEYRHELDDRVRAAGPVAIGLREMARGNYEEAIAQFDKAATPDDPLPLFWKASCQRRTKTSSYRDALGTYDRIVETFPSPAVKLLARSERLACQYDAGDMLAVAATGMDDSFMVSVVHKPAWAVLISGAPDAAVGRLRELSPLLQQEHHADWLNRWIDEDTLKYCESNLALFLGPRFWPADTNASSESWAATVGRDSDALWQNGRLGEAVAAADRAAEPALLLEAGQPENAAKAILGDRNGLSTQKRQLLVLSWLYRQDADIPAALAQLEPSAPDDPLALLQVRLHGLHSADAEQAKALFSAEADLYRGLYSSAKEKLRKLQAGETSPLIAAETARLLCECAQYVHESPDPALLLRARELYRKAAEESGPVAEWALHCLLRIGLAEKDADAAALAGEVIARFPKTATAEDARRELSAIGSTGGPVLCSSIKTPDDFHPQTVFRRDDGFVLVRFDPTDRDITELRWTDGMGYLIARDDETNPSWTMRSLVWPGWSFRPGFCTVDFFRGGHFVARRHFSVFGRLPNEEPQNPTN